jgi:hypothetical protein
VEGVEAVAAEIWIAEVTPWSDASDTPWSDASLVLVLVGAVIKLSSNSKSAPILPFALASFNLSVRVSLPLAGAAGGPPCLRWII